VRVFIRSKESAKSYEDFFEELWKGAKSFLAVDLKDKCFD
jgi:hypothetical protein